jgi:hypothetical protein
MSWAFSLLIILHHNFSTVISGCSSPVSTGTRCVDLVVAVRTRYHVHSMHWVTKIHKGAKDFYGVATYVISKIKQRVYLILFVFLGISYIRFFGDSTS